MFKIQCEYINHFAVHNILGCHEQLKFMSMVCCCFSDGKCNICAFCIEGVGVEPDIFWSNRKS